MYEKDNSRKLPGEDGIVPSSLNSIVENENKKLSEDVDETFKCYGGHLVVRKSKISYSTQESLTIEICEPRNNERLS